MWDNNGRDETWNDNGQLYWRAATNPKYSLTCASYNPRRFPLMNPFQENARFSAQDGSKC